MIMDFLLLFLPLISFFATAIFASTANLELVQVLFRHGDRNPTNAFPTDTNTEDTWPQGFGELTQVGMQQHYELGQFFKHRYIDSQALLNENYSRYQVDILSTNVDRTLMSAAADLSGMFAPQGNQIWNANISWQPIPIHTMPNTEDYFLSLSATCPTYDVLQNESLKSKDYVDKTKEYEDFMKKLNMDSGFNGSIGITNIYHVSDPLRVEQLKKRTLPGWTDSPQFWENLTYLATYAMGQLYDTTAKAHLRGGPLLGLMIKNMMESKNSSDSPDKKTRMHMYSAHDVTVVSFLSALKIFNHKLPPYASAVGVELWKNSSDYFVKTWYRNDTKEDVYSLTLPNCEESCPLKTFLDLTKDAALAEEDIKKECGVLVTTPNFWIPMAIGIALFLMFFVFVSLYFFCSTHNHNHSLLREVEDPW